MAKNPGKKFDFQWDKHMCLTPVVRLSFPQLFTPRAFENEPDGKKNYRCDLLFTKEQLSESYKGTKATTPSIQRIIKNAKITHWGPNEDKWPHFEHPAIKKGSTKLDGKEKPMESYKGLFYISPKTGEKFPPKILDKYGRPIAESEIYGGCWVRCQIIARAYTAGSKKGVSLFLNQVMKEKDGEKFGGVPDMFDYADENEDDEVDEDVNDEDGAPRW